VIEHATESQRKNQTPHVSTLRGSCGIHERSVDVTTTHQQLAKLMIHRIGTMLTPHGQ
jgi:hypothetical protein